MRPPARTLLLLLLCVATASANADDEDQVGGVDDAIANDGVGSGSGHGTLNTEALRKVQFRLAQPPGQGLTLVHFSAQVQRIVWDRGCA
jgi:hypothetical protein